MQQFEVYNDFFVTVQEIIEGIKHYNEDTSLKFEKTGVCRSVVYLAQNYGDILRDLVNPTIEPDDMLKLLDDPENTSDSLLIDVAKTIVDKREDIETNKDTYLLRTHFIRDDFASK